MASRLLKKNSFLLLVILVGIFSFSVCHASVMAHNMDTMSCHAQKFCGACPAPLISEHPALDNPLISIESFSEKPSRLPDPILDPFYHPPR
jgi:hypothetical protein